MSAEMLRGAAALMRGRAEAAERSWPSPWFYLGGEVHHSDFVADERAYDRPYVCNADGTDADQHIAGMHPAVALAVADWLDSEAESFDTTELWFHPDDSASIQEDKGFMFKDALTVARAYLGES